MKRFLITTAIESTWKFDEPVLFLGEWCKLYNRKAVWEKLNAKVMPYHWDDRDKLLKDYHYLQKLYEDLLLELSMKLNDIHRVDHSLRYWRILIGPWLGYFIQMVFDRWSMVDMAIQQKEITGVKILKIPYEQNIPNDMGIFLQFIVSDKWNEAIYGQVLRNYTNIHIEEVLINDLKQPNLISASSLHFSGEYTFRNLIRNNLISSTDWISKNFCKEDEIFSISSGLPIYYDFLLQLRLGQFPKYWHSYQPPQSLPNFSHRKWNLITENNNIFERIIRKMIPENIPALYLEGYVNLINHCANLPWPKKPRVCFTSNIQLSDDIFKSWAALKVEEGRPLVLGQHGGGYGISNFIFIEDHEIKISDKYLTWGWKRVQDQNVEPVFTLKTPNEVKKRKSYGSKLLLVTTVYPRLSYKLTAEPISSQWLNYFEDQCKFTDALPFELQKKLLVRLHRVDLGWFQKQRWNERFPHVRIDEGITPMISIIKNARLYVSTYNATSFLESLSLKIPTIIFWNPEYCELNEEAIPYFIRLREVGIFHTTAESAAAKVAEIWEQVPGWWNLPEIQEARKYFCHRFARNVQHPTKFLKDILLSVKAG